MPVTIREHDVKASNLIFVSIALYVVQRLIYWPITHLSEPKSILWLLFGLTGTITLNVVLAFGIRSGYSWVRILFVLLTVPTIFFGLKDVASLKEPISKVILPLIAMVLQGWAVVIIVKTQLSYHD